MNKKIVGSASESDSSCWGIACRAIEEVQNHSKEERERFFRGGNPIPASIPVGNGKMVFITEEGIEAIRRIGKRWRLEKADRKARIAANRVGDMAVREFGQMLEENGLALWSDDRQAIRDFKLRLQSRLENAFKELDHYFPCHILESAKAPSFDVGSIRYLRRRDWLEYAVAVAGSELPWMNLVREYWNGAGQPERPKDVTARQVIDTVESCQWIAVVQVRGNEFGRSGERARYAVRLGLDSLGIVLARPQALRIRGPGDELRVTRTGTLSQYRGRSLNTGTSIDHPSVLGHDPHAAEFLKDSESLRADAGWAIEAVLRLPNEIELQKLKHRWCDALYWFGEARRDSTEFTALVRYGMSLDVLAKGKRKNGIVSMLSDLLGVKSNHTLLTDGTSLASAIEKIYDEGRSQFGHGGRPALLEDLPIARDTADQVTRLALELYLLNLKRYQGPDEPDDFLKAIPSMVVSARKKVTPDT